MRKQDKIFVGIIIILISAELSLAKDWKEHQGRRFIIYYNEAPIDFIKEVEEAANRYYEEISNDMDFKRSRSWTWDERAKIYIYDNEVDFVDEGRHLSWAHGMALPRSKIIQTFPAAHGFFDSTLPHELGHIIFREFIGFDAQIPSWFEEGVAMYQEKAKRFGADDFVRTAMSEGKFIELNKLSLLGLYRQQNEEQIGLFYAESASAVNFLINEFGQHRFVRFCRKLQEGKPFDWALDEVYVRIKNTDELNKRWVEFLNK